MKQESLNRRVKTNVTNTQSFQFEATPEAAQMLSATLYSDKIGAVVRELSCNALDAHVMNGNESTPFNINLPSIISPTFEVQDFGIGLNEEEIKEIFTTYFRSTKRNTNTQTGAFGLGSKSPFAYTDSFVVASIKDGYKCQFSCYKNDVGMPTLSLLSRTETDEGTGTKVSMPVNSKDFHKFEEATIKQLTFFKVKPLINNQVADYDSWHKAREYTQGAHYLLLGKWVDAIAIQGSVAYRLDYNLVSSTPAVNLCRNVGISLKFELGEIGVSPNRESLSYDKRTIAAIEKKAKLACDEYTGEILASVLAAKNKYETRKIWYETPHYVDKFLSSISKDYEAKIEDLTLFIPSSEHLRIEILSLESGRLHNERYRRGYRHSISTDRTILVNDYGKGAKSAVRRVGSNDMLLVTGDDLPKFKDILSEYGMPIVSLKSHLESVNYNPKDYTATAPKVARVGNVNAFYMGRQSIYQQDDSLTAYIDDDTKTHYYVNSSNFILTSGELCSKVSSKQQTEKYLQNLTSLAKAMKLVDTDFIHVINKKDSKAVENLPHFVEFIGFAQRGIKDKFSDRKYLEEILDNCPYPDINFSYYNNSVSDYLLPYNLQARHLLVKELKKIKRGDYLDRWLRYMVRYDNEAEYKWIASEFLSDLIGYNVYATIKSIHKRRGGTHNPNEILNKLSVLKLVDLSKYTYYTHNLEAERRQIEKAQLLLNILTQQEKDFAND